MKPVPFQAGPVRAPLACLLMIVALVTGRAGEPEGRMVKVVPRESDELLANPGMGWQTFNRFADEDANLQGLPSASAYYRGYWREIEPRDGQIDFAKFDELLAHARRAGQRLAFRVMCTGSEAYMDVPAWLKAAGCQGVEFSYGGGVHWVPDFADPVFQDRHGRLIRELGRRYDGHPDLDLVDIGSVGLWGEWHMSGTVVTGIGQPVPMPSLAIRQGIINAWCAAFPSQTKAIQIGSEEGMMRTVKDRLGWRADCLGDMGGFSKTWNHMNDFYLQQLEKTGARAAWKAAPVAFETCWDMRKWKEAGWDIPFIFNYALHCHASYVNNKSAPLPEGARPEVERFLRRLGYRLVIRSVQHEVNVGRMHKAAVAIQWENVGVAPPYRDYRVALRLSPADRPGEASIVVTDLSVRGWLPGTHSTEASFELPPTRRAGRYELAIGVVDPGHDRPAVRLAVVGRDADGWYPVSHFEVMP